jgi:hypothetical protein
VIWKGVQGMRLDLFGKGRVLIIYRKQLNDHYFTIIKAMENAMPKLYESYNLSTDEVKLRSKLELDDGIEDPYDQFEVF